HIAYIAMEYVEGRSLASYLSSKVRFTDTDIPGIMSQLLDALGHAHDNGVWHRDVKPANIIMMANGRLKVADFGIARIE
ncbi:protein kinase, partial [Acinetobacter baumannii]